MRSVVLRYLYLYLHFYLTARRTAARRREDEDDFFFEEFLNSKYHEQADENQDDTHISALTGILGASFALQNRRRKAGPRKANQDRSFQKGWWCRGYANWDGDQFRSRLRITRPMFELLLDEISPIITKTPTNLVPNPIEAHRQLALTIYRLAHGISFLVLSDLFGVSHSLCVVTFNEVCRVLVAKFYDRYVYLPRTDDEWEAELRGFLENYGFPCVGAWDGFHVQWTTKLKNHYSFKKKYTVNNMGFIGHNKRFLAATIGAPGNTHDARLLRHTKAFTDIIEGHAIPDRQINLGEHGTIPLVTVGDSAFPQFPWLIKGYDEKTRDQAQRFYNIRLRSARVVTENCYGMCKGRWRILYKPAEMKKYNLKYITMSCLMLHNMCIHFKDPCEPRWILKVDELNTYEKDAIAPESKLAPSTTRDIVKNWLWNVFA